MVRLTIRKSVSYPGTDTQSGNTVIIEETKPHAGTVRTFALRDMVLERLSDLVPDVIIFGKYVPCKLVTDGCYVMRVSVQLSSESIFVLRLLRNIFNDS